MPVIVAHEHTWSFEGQPLRRFLDRELIARGASVFIAVSREDRRRMIEIESIDPGEVMFLPNGIPRRRRRAAPTCARSWASRPDAPVIGTVGVLRPQKALDVLVRAAACWRASSPACAC